MPHEVTLINGDGTGPELAAAARACIDATGVKINWDIQEAGVDIMAKNGGNPLPEVLRWKFGPRAGVPSVQTRIRLATSQIVTAVAKMRDGTFRQDSIELLVTLAACIDD